MERFAGIVLRHRLWVIVGTVILTGFFALGLTRLWVNSDFTNYLKPDDPAVKLFNRIGEEYRGNLLVMVGIETEDVFTLSTLKLVRDLTEAFREIDGVASVMSLTDIIDIREVEGTLEVGNLIDKDNLPSSPQELKRLREYVLSKEMYRGRIVSPDGRITIIICRLGQGVDKTAVAREIKETGDSMAGDVKTYYSGVPVFALEAQRIIVQDARRLIPTALAVVVLVLFLSFRSFRGVILPLIAVLVSVIWAVGLMGWMGVPFSIISNITPVLLIAIGTAYGIHLLSKYYEEEDEDGRLRTRRALNDVGVPILLAGLTTLIGFLSFIGAYITAITDAGVFTAIGVGVATLMSLSLIPVILSFLKPKRARVRIGGDDHLFTRMMGGLADFILRRRKHIMTAVFIVALVAIAGLPRINREVNLMEYFPEDSGIRISEEMMQAKFGGSTPIQIVVKGDMGDPFVLKEMRRMEKFLDSLPYVSNSQSIADLICEMNRVMNGHYTIPETFRGVANLWFFIEGKEILKQLVNGDRTEGIIQAQVGTTDTGIRLGIVDAIERHISEISPGIEVVRVSDLSEGELAKAKEWLYGEMVEDIYLDATARYPEFKIERERLKEEVRKALEAKVTLSDETLRNLKVELRDYFEMESEIMVPENLMPPLVEEVLRMASSGRTEKSDYLDLLRRMVPGEILDKDPDAVGLTAETLAAKIREIRRKSRIQLAISQLISLFPEKLRDDPDFKDDLCEDLWAVNEDIWGLPPKLGLGKGQRTVQIALRQSGMPIIYKRLDRNLLKSQIQSFIIAFLLVFMLLSIQHRSAGVGLITSSPIVLTVLINFAVMAYAGVSLDFATMMLASVAIGIGIDYSIHFSSRYKLELGRLSDPALALEKTLQTTGRAILINALTVGLGFSVLLFGQLSPIRRFGWMVTMTMIVSALSAIIYLPSMLLTGKEKRKR
jgi:hypothetical protein